MSLTLIVGCMFSGKSTELIRLVNRYKSIGKNILTINHSLDQRYSRNMIVSHSGNKVAAVQTNILPAEVEDYDIIAIDEGQFFTDLVTKVLEYVETHNKTVIVAGLSGDFQRRPFGSILQLMPLCDKLWMATAYCSVCKDGTKASFTKRLSNSTEQIAVGEADQYIAVCRKCYTSV
tara:strand:- start:82 stop:609 length:528 start_codon:yes stop_codon:yes gene_type:complete